MQSVLLLTGYIAVKRWLVTSIVLLGLSAILARYFDPGAPADWPVPARLATGMFLAPGGVTWTVLFWHPFSAGPTEMGLAFVALLNSAIWLLAIYALSKVFRWLRRHIPTKGRP
jgi:hypothetical protein